MIGSGGEEAEEKKEQIIALGVLGKRVVGGVGASPHAGRLAEPVADQAVRAAVGEDARGLVGKGLGWIDQFSFEGDLFVGAAAVLGLQGLPGSNRHHAPPK